MITKTELKEHYGNSMNINIIIDSFADEDDLILDASRLLRGEKYMMGKDAACELVKMHVEQLCKDLLKKVN